MGDKYVEVEDGDWITIQDRRDHRIRCCDCGLVHKYEFREAEGKLEFRVRRDRRATAAVRRTMAPSLKKALK